MSRKAADVVKSAKKMIRDKYVYVYGYKGTKVTKQGVKNLARSYPSVYTPNILSMAMDKVGKMGIDCSGFVNKACDTDLGGSTNIKDHFTTKYKVSDSSHVVNGMGIWHQGHIALIEVDDNGDAYIIEARSTARDLTRTKWSERANSFTYYGKIPGVNYTGASIKGKGKISSAKTKGKVNLYKKEDVKSGKYFSLDNGTPVNYIKDCGNGWSKVIYKSKTGYIKNTGLNKIGLSKYPVKHVKATDQAALRKKNSKVSKKITILKSGTKVSVVCKRKYWTNVIVNGKKGWVATKKIAW